MIVADASAILELLVGTTKAPAVATRLLDSGETVHAPHLLDVEVVHVLRRLCRMRQITAGQAEEMLEDFVALRLSRHPHAELLPRIWALRDQLTAYDATYVALAEALGASLLTCDEALAGSRGHSASIELV